MTGTGTQKPESRTARVDEALLQRMTAALVEAADPEQVILFGSRARGDAGPESDVDLIVVEAEPFGPERDRFAWRKRGCAARFPVSTSPWTSSSSAAMTWITGATRSTMCSPARSGKARCSMSDLKCARILVEAADKDVAALHLWATAAFADEIFLHAQQAAEKSFKAWLALLGETYPLTHDLQRLLDRPWRTSRRQELRSVDRHDLLRRPVPLYPA